MRGKLSALLVRALDEQHRSDAPTQDVCNLTLPVLVSLAGLLQPKIEARQLSLRLCD